MPIYFCSVVFTYFCNSEIDGIGKKNIASMFY